MRDLKRMFDSSDWNSEINVFKNFWTGDRATDHLNQRQNERQEETYNRERKLDFRLAQRAEANSPVNQKDGMQQAGYSPVMTEGVAPASGSAGSTGQPTGGNSKGTGLNPLALANLALLKAQKDNLDANTEKVGAETDNLEEEKGGITARSSLAERELDSKKEYDDLMVAILKRDFRNIYDSLVRSRYNNDEALADANMTGGALEGLGIGQHVLRQIAEDAVEELVSDKILHDPSTISALSSMGRLEARKMSNEIEYVGIQAKELAYDYELLKRYASKFKDEELTKLNRDIKGKEQEIRESIARVDKMGSEKAKNWSEVGKNIISSLTSVINVVK